MVLWEYVYCCLRYDSSKGKWEPSEPMKTLRSRVGVAVVNKQLYAFGGYDGSARLSTVECFNPQACPSETHAPLPCLTNLHSACRQSSGS